jgi:hypothetical protein
MGFLDRLKAPKATIAMLFDKGTYSLNEPVTGHLDISASEEFESDEIRIEMEVNEWVKATERQTAGEQQVNVTAEQNSMLHRGKHTVTGGKQFSDGTNESIPFSINLPPSVPPTYRSNNARNTWTMKAVVGIKGRPDVTTNETEVTITY